jgi:hypothetical protein
MRKVLLLFSIISIVCAGWSYADWNPGDLAKWVQEPDLTSMGIDVNASEPYILADDFLCEEAGLITGIHIWGSWFDDALPGGLPENVIFTLSIHKDIPADQSPTGYSMPGDLLWMKTFQPGQFVARRYNQGVPEGWLDPPEQYMFPADWTCWQYNFMIDPLEAFHQDGSPDNPIVYWLDVQAMPISPDTRFGWKTSIQHWNDDAVWGQGIEPYLGPWGELRYPPGHEQQGQSMDLSFVIVGEPEPQDLDFGDAPDGVSIPGYPTLLVHDGARHLIGGPWFCDAAGGDFPDTEPDGQPDPNALGDDNDGFDDENGVTIPPMTQGQFATIQFMVCGGGGFVGAWIDWNGDLTWSTTEKIVSGVFPDGVHNITVLVPNSTVLGQTYARFRVSSTYGLAPDGEVEDYELYIEEAPEEYDFGDAPDSPGALGYPTLLVNNGARHLIRGPWLGDLTDGPDAEPDGQPNLNATGDDFDGNDDEDGVQIPPMQQTVPAIITYEVNGGNGFVEGWIDWNGDQSWDASELILSGMYAPGFHNINVVPPAASIIGQTFARFRISSAGTGSPMGPATDGEVEDHEVWIDEGPQTYKWEQRPDLTPTGIDVNATRPYILADDFLCTQTGRILDIYVWGSWLDDHYPWQEDPQGVRFALSFHADIPAGPNQEYSMPGETLWLHHFLPGSFTAQVYAGGIEEGWMDPPDNYIFPADWTCWLYKFSVPESEAFLQTGTPENPMVYWLDVQAIPQDTTAVFGWKTSVEHWNDDAVWGRGLEPFPGPWYELRYPPNHPYGGESIDLAFRLVGVEEPQEYDFGDAPDPTFPTWNASGGAYHIINPAIFMGNLIDAEPDGQPDPNAQGDDMNGVDDEDGVTFATVLRPGAPQNVTVIVSANGFIDAWVDFHGDGSWATPGDQIFASAPVAPGPNVLTFTVPPTGSPGQYIVTRWRYSTTGGLPYTGMAQDGEVEDHMIYIEDDMTGTPDRQIPDRFEVYQNAPNPFNPMTTIRFDLPTPQRVVLTVYTVDGRRVATVIDEPLTAGAHGVVWNGRNDAGQPVASGTYFYRVEAGPYSKTERMTLIK